MIELPLFSHFGCSAGGQLGSPADSWDKPFCRPGIEHSGLQKHSLLLPLLSMIEEAIVGSAIGIGLHERRIAFLESGSDRPEILDDARWVRALPSHHLDELAGVVHEKDRAENRFAESRRPEAVPFAVLLAAAIEIAIHVRLVGREEGERSHDWQLRRMVELGRGFGAGKGACPSCRCGRLGTSKNDVPRCARSAANERERHTS
mmetsp:Transcript_16734/g.39730  ORF Transcript_16734/g.39730 Transcript_16734/m.39730 type:complete len:204 (+) Transcript_16734:1180-1791(+)